MKDISHTDLAERAREKDAFGNYRDDTGRLIVVERPRNDGRKLNYRRTTTMDRDIAQDYSDGHLTVAQIAEAYETSDHTVRRVALNHGVAQRQPGIAFSKTKIDDDQAIRLRQEGYSITEIAEILGHTRNGVAAFFGRRPETKLTHAESVKRRKTAPEFPNDYEI